MRCAVSFAMSRGYANATRGRRAGSVPAGSASACDAITTSAVVALKWSTAARAVVAQELGNPDPAVATDDLHKAATGPPVAAAFRHWRSLARSVEQVSSRRSGRTSYSPISRPPRRRSHAGLAAARSGRALA
jgi:hypothetical protein